MCSKFGDMTAVLPAKNIDCTRKRFELSQGLYQRRCSGVNTFAETTLKHLPMLVRIAKSFHTCGEYFIYR